MIKKELNVLSVFDGMSCGQLALKKARVKVKQYYASEVDKAAISVTQSKFPNTIQLGDVTKVKAKDLPKIDLLIGGSPCQGFSLMGKQLNFEDERSILFFEFVRLLKECKPKYFLLENTPMKQSYADIITDLLGVEPVLINSNLVSAQNRKRLYWTNIPGVKQPKDKGILVSDILQSGVDQKYFLKNKHLAYWNEKKDYLLKKSFVSLDPEKAICMTARQFANWKGNHVTEKRKVRQLTPVECERLQTVPDNYTAAASDSQRYKMLGNGWTVDIIAHIFKNIKQ